MSQNYIPERNHIVCLDFEPTNGKEIGKYRPALILSSREYNSSTGLVICCPISTSIRGGITEVNIGNLEKPSVVAASLVQTLSWKERKIKFIIEAELAVMDEVLFRIIPLIGADKLIEKLVSLEDFKSYEETEHLIASPKNAKRLSQSIAEVEAGKSKQHGIIDE